MCSFAKVLQTCGSNRLHPSVGMGNTQCESSASWCALPFTFRRDSLRLSDARGYRVLVALGIQKFTDETAQNGRDFLARAKRHNAEELVFLGRDLGSDVFGVLGHARGSVVREPSVAQKTRSFRLRG